MRTLILALVVAIALAAPLDAGANQASLVLSPGFMPNPLTVRELPTEERDYVFNAQYPGCDTTTVPRRPLLTFQLTAELEALAVSFENRFHHKDLVGFVVFPDGHYVCQDRGASGIFFKKWPSGTYKLYFVATKSHDRTIDVRFEQELRIKEAARQRAASVPTYDIWSGMPTNPLWISPAIPAPGNTKAGARDLGLTECIHPYFQDFVQPVVKLNLKEDMASLYLSSQDDIVLLAEDGTCLKPKEIDHLKAGIYTSYRIVEWDPIRRLESPPEVPGILEIDDRTRPLAFTRSGEPTPIGDLAKPLVLSGKVRPAGRLPTRDGECTAYDGTNKFPTNPDFYLVSREPIPHVTLRLLGRDTTQMLRIFGPLETVTKQDATHCKRSNERLTTLDFEVFEGTYAVWIGAREGAGSDFHLMLLNKKTEIDPLTLLVHPPAGLPLEQRILGVHYPFLTDEGDVHDQSFRLFTEVPEELFVYARVGIDLPAREEGKGRAPIKGEPLLVHWINDTSAEVVTHEGDTFHVPLAFLTIERPTEVHFLDMPRPPKHESTSLDQAIDLAGVEDKKDIDQHRALEQKYRTCVENYMAQNDPDSDRDILSRRSHVIIQNGRISGIEDYSNFIARKAEARCGAKRVELSEKTLQKLLSQRREKRRDEQFQAVKKRFGL